MAALVAETEMLFSFFLDLRQRLEAAAVREAGLWWTDGGMFWWLLVGVRHLQAARGLLLRSDRRRLGLLWPPQLQRAPISAGKGRVSPACRLGGVFTWGRLLPQDHWVLTELYRWSESCTDKSRIKMKQIMNFFCASVWTNPRLCNYGVFLGKLLWAT